MLDQMVNSATASYLQRGLQAATLRHEVIANNVANVNTPNFKRSYVVFEDLLAREIYGEEGKGMPMVRTHDRHLPTPMRTKAAAAVELEDKLAMRTDNNNVDIDVEMADMAKNQLYYNSLATQLSGYYRKLKSVLQGGSGGG